jgi:hypothetical protein
VGRPKHALRRRERRDGCRARRKSQELERPEPNGEPRPRVDGTLIQASAEDDPDRARATSLLMIGLAVAALTGCGGSTARRPVGPNVVGMSLSRAEGMLVQNDLGYEEHFESGLLGVGADGRTIRTGCIVCGES